MYPQLANQAWLREQYVAQERSCEHIAREVGCTLGTVFGALSRHGIPTRPPITKELPLALLASRAEQFWEKVDKRGPDDCWEWCETLKRYGYGRFHVRGHTYGAHRVSWALAHGQIPPGLSVLHACDNPGCVNPAHLSLGTFSDNTRDAFAKGRQNAPDGRLPRAGAKNGRARLTPEQVREIREARWGQLR